MAIKLVSIVTGGSNNHETSSAEINGIATDFISQGVVRFSIGVHGPLDDEIHLPYKRFQTGSWATLQT